EIGTSGLMSGEGKRSALAIPRLSSTLPALVWVTAAAATAESTRGAFARDFRFAVSGVEGCWGGPVRGARPHGYGPAGCRLLAILRNRSASGQAAAHTRGRLRDASGDLEQSCA